MRRNSLGGSAAMLIILKLCLTSKLCYYQYILICCLHKCVKCHIKILSRCWENCQKLQGATFYAAPCSFTNRLTVCYWVVTYFVLLNNNSFSLCSVYMFLRLNYFFCKMELHELLNYTKTNKLTYLLNQQLVTRLHYTLSAVSSLASCLINLSALPANT